MLDISVYKKEEMPYKSNSFLKWMWFFIKPYKKRFFILSINRAFGAGLYLTAPFFVNKLIEFINSSGFENNKNYAYFYLLGIFIVFTIGNISAYFRKYETFFRDELKRKLTIFSTIQNLELPLSWHENQGTGNKMQRILTARESFKGMLSLYFGNIMQEIGRLLTIIIILLFSAPWYVSIIFFVYMILFLVLAYFKSGNIGYLTNQVNIFYEKVIGKGYEFASSIFTVKFFNLPKFIKKKSKKVENEQMGKIKNLINAIYKKWIYLNFYGSLGYIIIGPLALYLYINGVIIIGVLIIIIWYIGDTRDSVVVFGDIQDDYIEYKSGFMLLTEILKIKTEKYDFDPIKKFPKKLENIIFDNLSFTYGSISNLDNINLKIKSGEKIALVGKSGSGKSTFVKILMKQVLPKNGGIYFNDINIKNIKKDDLLKNISVVLQDTELFNISIRDNILLNINGTKEFKNELLKRVLRMAYCDDFVNKLEKKENTVIGEKGVKLSGGEKQRIGIARALARKSKILIFDEATSSLDTKSERIIQKAMGEIFKGKTAFIVAHRLSTIKEVDRILVFKDGKIIEDGSFEELLKIKGEFSKLWKLQKLD